MKTYKELLEKINMTRAKMGDVIKDFQASDAPQFKGKSKEKRRQMAIAAKLEADRGVKEETDIDEEAPKGYGGKPVTGSRAEYHKTFRYVEKKYGNKPSPKKMKEEVEELDELSTDTLRSYRNKARDDAFDAHDVDDDRRLRKRSYGANQAGKKILKRGEPLRKEEVEQTDEELKGNQHKIDANKNGKVDSNDFKILRNAKKARYQ